MCLPYRLDKQSGEYLIFAGCSVPQSHLTLCNPMDYATPGSPVLHHLPEFAQTHVHWVGDAIQPSHPLLSPSLPAFKFSQHQSPLQWVSSSHQVAEVLELQLQHQPFQWIFRADFLSDRLIWSPCHPRDSQKSSPAPQLKTFNSLALSLLYAPTLIFIHDYWKNYSLILWTFVGQVISLLFNMLSWLVLTVSSRSKHLLISWLQSPSAVILELKKIMLVTVSIVSLSICHEVIGLDALIFVFWMLSFEPVFSLLSFSFEIPIKTYT